MHQQAVNTNSVRPFFRPGIQFNWYLMSNFTQQHVLPSREIVSIVLAYQTDSFSVAPLVQETPYCNSTPFTSLLRSHSNPVWEESSGGPTMPSSQILSPTPSYPLNTSLSQTALITLLYQTWSPLQASASAFNVIPLWSLGFRPGFPMFPAGHPCFIPILAGHPHLAGLVRWPWPHAQWTMLILSLCFVGTGPLASWHMEMLPVTLTFLLLAFPALPTRSLL